MRSILSALVLVGLLFGCGGGGGGSTAISQPSAPAGPTNLTVTPGPNPTEIILAWTPPTQAVDNYILEFKAGSGAFQALSPIPPSLTSVSLYYGDSAPEMTNFTFRVMATRGTSSTPYSNEVTDHHGLNAPIQISGFFDWTAMGISLSWARNTSEGTGFKVQRAESNNTGTPTGAWTDLTVSSPMASSYLDQNIQPDKYYVYRLANTNGSTSSAYATSGAVFTGIPVPTYLSAYYDSNQSGVNLSWYNTGQALPVLLERAVSDAVGTPQGGWQALAVPTGPLSSFLDKDVAEFTTYTYRVSNLAGQIVSAPTSPSYPVTTPMLGPINLVATPAVGGIQLTWLNRSQVATQVTVLRGGYLSAIAILSPGSTSYLDPNPPLGFYTYRVDAQSGSTSAYSPTATVATPNSPNALKLSASTLAYPNAMDASIRPSGSWAFLSGQPFGVISNNDPWQPTFPNNSRGTAFPTVQVDAQGWPHAVYFISDPQNTQSYILRHIWTDGTTWNSENLGQTNISFTSATFGYTYHLDSAGVPHVLLDHSDSNNPYGGSTSTLTYVHKVNGAWVSDSLASLTPAVFNIGTYHLLLDGTDTPHIVLGNWGSVLEYVPDGAGGWTSTTLPTGSVYAGWYDFLEGVWTDANTASVFYERSNSFGYSLMVLQKVGGAWQLPIELGTREHNGASTTAQVAISPDRSKVAALYSTNIGLKAYHLTGSGWVAGGDEQRIALAEGEAAFISRGEVHSKGSENGMTAFMLQVRDLTLPGKQQ